MVELKQMKEKHNQPYSGSFGISYHKRANEVNVAVGVELLWSAVLLEGKTHVPVSDFCPVQTFTFFQGTWFWIIEWLRPLPYTVLAATLSFQCCLLSEQVSLCPSPFLSEVQASIREICPLEWQDCSRLPLFAQ